MSRTLAQRIEKLSVLAETITRRQVVAVALDLPECPAWALPLSDGCVYLIGGDAASRGAALEALRTDAPLPSGVLLHDYRGKPDASRAIFEMNNGEAREVAVWGARGDRKTSAALDGWLLKAHRHGQAGGTFPYRVIVPTGSHREHKDKLCRTLKAGHWYVASAESRAPAPVWDLTDDDHVATATVDGVALVALDLFGTSDPEAVNRVRTEAHGLWAEEAAPATYEGGGGVTEDAWVTALTSLRMLSPLPPVAVMTSNYAEEDFTFWRRFETQPIRGTVSIQIRPGESASEEDRARWREQLASRPDLLDRLVNGKPATIPQGPQVAVGYREDIHVAEASLSIERSLELWLAWDSAPNAKHHACIVGQRNGRRRLIYAGLVGELMDFDRFLTGVVVPWLQRRAPWTVGLGGEDWLEHVYDPNMDPAEPVSPELWCWGKLKRALGGHGQPGPPDWFGRSNSMLMLLGDTDGQGGPALQIDPGADTAALRKALGSRWHYATTRGGTVVRDLPAKPNHPHEDLGDAFAYLASIFAPELYRSRLNRRRGDRPTPAKIGFRLGDVLQSWRSGR